MSTKRISLARRVTSLQRQWFLGGSSVLVLSVVWSPCVLGVSVMLHRDMRSAGARRIGVMLWRRREKRVR
ncbi:hypothetical protein KSC_076880 [Ktedonobacter sp. SOSP1-52]|uniref:hypothetical protein n=1 Tax=Ktedonobacter sp. SOSP1-52 TaxID=2778366 RepID=UPI001915AE1C|nr:hypothetical protein [Ktedonobacter sp. SOSP1-52]GHO68796.1 hypothetical protein KSC_076880 [Ktedonobacter sp. SOSP1-52]